MYTLNITTGIVTKDSTGVQVAPAQSTDDVDYVAYIDWVNEGNSPTEVVEESSAFDFTNSKSLDYAFTTNNTPYTSIALTPTYITAFRFVFGGTNVIGKPTMVKVVGNVSIEEPTAKIRLQDVTNSITIASVENITNTEVNIIDLGELSNLSSTECILELQIAGTSGTGTFQISALQIQI